MEFFLAEFDVTVNFMFELIVHSCTILACHFLSGHSWGQVGAINTAGCFNDGKKITIIILLNIKGQWFNIIVN